MIDCFALLQQPRQPWLDSEALKQQFLKQSAQLHPDKVAPGNEGERAAAVARFAEINSAYQLLRETKSRLAHLIELESGAAPRQVQQVSGNLADLFFSVSALCRQVDQFLARRTGATSPLVKASLFAEGLQWTGRLQEQQQDLTGRSAALDDELRSFNRAWSSSSESSNRPLPRLEEIYRQLSFLARWNSQLQERIVQLAM